MRLQCPNCDAQYEVADDAVPENGRDVQCSNCGHTWFQAHPDALLASEAEEDMAAPIDEAPDDAAQIAEDDAPAEEAEEPAAEDEPDGQLEADPVPPEVDPEDAPEEAGDDADEAEEDSGDAPELPERKPLDEGVASILREEAEREQRARAEEQGEALETQTEMGLEDGGDDTTGDAIAAMVATERAARLRGAEPAAEEAPGSRRDLLPDIEEINSTLRATSDRSDGVPDLPAEAGAAPAPRKSGFRRGFLLVVLLMVLALLVYVYAPQIAERFPGAAATLESYVAWVDGLRAWLDQAAKSATERIKALQEG